MERDNDVLNSISTISFSDIFLSGAPHSFSLMPLMPGNSLYRTVKNSKILPGKKGQVRVREMLFGINAETG
jgi:hypothetical protein